MLLKNIFYIVSTPAGVFYVSLFFLVIAFDLVLITIVVMCGAMITTLGHTNYCCLTRYGKIFGVNSDGDSEL